MKPTRSLLERETVITMNPGEPDALLWTINPIHVKKFIRLGYKVIQTEGESKLFKAPKACISFRKPLKPS